MDPTKTKEVREVESYAVSMDDVPAEIHIMDKGDYVMHYNVKSVIFGPGTALVMNDIKKSLVREVSVETSEILDPRLFEETMGKFLKRAKERVRGEFRHITDEQSTVIATLVISDMMKLGEMEYLLADDNLEEIVVNNSIDPIWVYHKKYGWLKTNIVINAENLIKHYAAVIARKEGKAITILEPLLDAHILETGDRVNATLAPISVKGNTITIRKFASKPWTITDIIKNKTISAEAAAFMWFAIQYETPTIISGGTASGKTSTLNIMSAFLPPNQRVVSIEDTRELQLPSFLHWIPMLTRLPNPEGKGGVSMLNLLVNSLRQRPDRIIVGEIRRKKEAEVLLEAIHTGHSVYGTVHANDADETIVRLTNPPIDLPKAMIPAISLILVQTRNRRTGRRRILEIAEILPDARPNIIGKLDVAKDRFNLNLGKSKILFTDLQRFTGLSRSDILKSLKEKEEVLNWLVKKNINTVDGVGHVIAKYYTEKDKLFKEIRKRWKRPGSQRSR